MASSPSYMNNNYHGDKYRQKQGCKKTKTSSNYDAKAYSNQTVYSTKNQYNQKTFYESSYEYPRSNYVKKDNYYDSYDQNWKYSKDNAYYYNKSSNNSAYSTYASEADMDNELAGFKIIQSGKTLHDGQLSSDSDCSVPEVEKREERRFASALTYIGPNPHQISVPSFL